MKLPKIKTLLKKNQESIAELNMIQESNQKTISELGQNILTFNKKIRD